MIHHATARPTGTRPARTSTPAAGTAGAAPAAAGRRRPARRVRSAALGTALTALLASGCAATAAAGDDATPTGEATQTGSTVPFGRPFEYGDGLFVTVKAPQEFEPSAEAEGVEEGGVPVRLRVQVTNGTKAPYTPSTLSATAVSDGVAASPIWDAAREVDTAGPYVTLDPGGTVSFDIGFAVADPSDMQVSVLPALGGYDALVVTTD